MTLRASGPRRADGLTWRWLDGRTLVVLNGSGAAFALNDVAGAVFESCDGQPSSRGARPDPAGGRPALSERAIAHALVVLAAAGLLITDADDPGRLPSGRPTALTVPEIADLPIIEPIPTEAFLPVSAPDPARARRLAATRWGVRVVIVDETDLDLANALPGYSLEEGGDGAADVRYVVRIPAGLAPWLEVERTRGDERSHVPLGGREEVLGWLSHDVDESIAICSRAGVFARASAVTWRGHAILVTDQGPPGPSPLVEALVGLGAAVHVDRLAVLDEEGRIQPGGEPHVTPGAPSLMPTLIVAMRHEQGAPWRPRVVRGAEAVLPILGCAAGLHRDPARGMRLVTRLASTVTTLTGAMPAAPIAAPHILKALDDVIDDRAGVLEPAAPTPAPDPPGPGPRAGNVTPARFVVIDDFLSLEECERVLAFACGHEAGFEPSQVRSGEASKIDDRLRRSRTLLSLEPIWDLFETRLRAILPFLRRELGVPWFPPGRIEPQLTAHEEGGLFGVHVDNGAMSLAGRRITGVYYVHRLPKRFSGGELRVYDSTSGPGRAASASTYRVIDCERNRAVFFASGTSHEVRPVHGEGTFADSRFAVNTWFWAGKRVARLGGTR